MRLNFSLAFLLFLNLHTNNHLQSGLADKEIVASQAGAEFSAMVTLRFKPRGMNDQLLNIFKK